MKKTIIIALPLALMLGGFLYVVSRISPGHSGIKRYSYSGGVEEFISHLKNFSKKNSGTSIAITDTTGNVKTNYTVYIDIELKNSKSDLLYGIACTKTEDSNNKSVLIELVMAYDKIHNSGGYNKKAKGVEPLVNNFDSNFLTRLKHDENMNVASL